MIVVPDAPEVIGWVERALNIKIAMPAHAFGYMTNDKEPVCAVVVNDYTGSNCELTIVAARPVSMPVVRHVFNYAFGKLGCRRVTVRTRKRNKLVQKLAARLGFKYEGIQKHFYADDDAVVFGMLKENCRWI